MSEPVLLSIGGDVAYPARLTLADLAALDALYQLGDIGRLDPRRKGDAVLLAGILALVAPRSTATYLTLHASADDFHASIPLAEVRDPALIVYRLDGGPLPTAMGGPVRFFIPNFATCHTDEIDECANVKFVDRIEFSVNRGHDNRPHNTQQHAALHDRDGQASV